MKLKIIRVGDSHGVIFPKTVMELFEINGCYKASFSKNRIVLDKIKTKPLEIMTSEILSNGIELIL